MVGSHVLLSAVACLGYSRISDADMGRIMGNAVDRVYALLRLKAENPKKYESEIQFGERYTTDWDDPVGLGVRDA